MIAKIRVILFALMPIYVDAGEFAKPLKDH